MDSIIVMRESEELTQDSLLEFVAHLNARAGIGDHVMFTDQSGNKRRIVRARLNKDSVVADLEEE